MNPLMGIPANTHGYRSGDIASERPVDVVVIGGGPAGTATAIAAADLGWSVTVLERSHYESTRIGETLPPEIKRPLIELGLWQQFLADGPIESPGIAAAWGQSELYNNDFVVNPHRPGWHVDRRRFDSMLARDAEERGVEVIRGTQGISVARDLSTPWRLGFQAGCRRLERRAALLVDATGRSTSPARRLGGHRIVYDRLVGLVGFIAAADPPGDRRTVIEAVPSGWWYSAPLPDGQHVAAFMTDADLIPAGHAARSIFWQDQLRQSLHIRARLGEAANNTYARVVTACSSAFVGRRG